MSDLKSFSPEGHSVRLSVAVSLFMVATVTIALTTWSARAQPMSPATGSDNAAAMQAAPVSTPDAESEAATASSFDQPPAIIGGSHNAATSEHQTPRQAAFSITWTRTLLSPDGGSRLLLTTTRYQRSDGAFKLVHTFHDRAASTPAEQPYYGFMGFGTFQLDEARRRLVFAAPMLEEETPDIEASLREHPQYDREEDVRGQRTIVWRTEADDGQGYTEEYRAPALGGLIIKHIKASRTGQEMLEPTDIRLGEPDASLFSQLSRYRVDYSDFERKIGETERRSGKEAARALRQALQRMRAAKPDGR